MASASQALCHLTLRRTPCGRGYYDGQITVQKVKGREMLAAYKGQWQDIISTCPSNFYV